MAKCIMIQGTMSNVGKSLIAGGLCRIFKQDGYKVCPFKSQNMALNSYITKEGLEMGRAQVMQAEASGIEPSVLMNPILLKPTNDKGSQVIVNGEVLATMSAAEYYRDKLRFVPDIMRAYNSLDREYDIIVIEGAGSPAEINLKDNDIVNMGMARLADAPVLLVGDIDRGGVFAQLLGTLDLLEKDERERVKGLIINKFRGDKSILKPGLDMLVDRGHIPVTGVVPYMHLDIDDEDSLTERFSKKDANGLVDIAVIRFPRISNFTDFNVFECMEEVSLRYVSAPAQLGKPDIVFLPGTKNTIGDLLWMRQNGLEAKLLQHAGNGGILFGVCGGYQMLGLTINDSLGVETERGNCIRGMGLLPIHTEFMNEKTRTQVKGEFGAVYGALEALSGKKIEGYEIHMGVSEYDESGKSAEGNVFSNNKNALTKIQPMYTNYNRDIPDEAKSPEMAEKADGAQQGNVYGSYVHGIFDNDDIAATIVSQTLCKKGLGSIRIKAFDKAAYKQSQYDALAKGLRASLDMESVYRIVGI